VLVSVRTWMGDHRQMAGYTISVYNQPPTPTQPGHSSLARCNEYQQKWGHTKGTPRDVLAPYPWSRSVIWCLAEG